jgi:hypothetical protein
MDRTEPQAIKAKGWRSQNDDAWDHRRPHVIRQGKYKTGRQPRTHEYAWLG